VNLYWGNDVIVIPPDGEPLRLPEKRLDSGLIPTIQLLPAELPEPAWLPAPDNDNVCGQEPFLPIATPGRPCTDASGWSVYAPVLYIVSMAVAQFAARLGRGDFIAPDTGSGAVRDADGKIIGVKGFVRYAIG
jgi:hypothetical protein